MNRIKSNGVSAKEVAAEHGISDTTVYNWLAASATQNPTMIELFTFVGENGEPRN